MIRLFEAEAGRRLRVAGGERQVTLTTTPGTSRVILPADFAELRQLSIGGSRLFYQPPEAVPQTSGQPTTYSLSGPLASNALGYRLARLDPQPDAEYELTVLYLCGVPPLGDAAPVNWLLATAPDCYLFGALAEAEAYIGHDERIPLWLQRREAAFASIEMADRKARWPGGGLQIRVDGITSLGGGGGTSSGGGGSGTPPPGGGDGGAVTVSEQAPASPQNGDLWFDLVSAQTFCWIDDFSSAQWVPVINQATGSGAPAPGITVLAPISGGTATLPLVGRYYVNNAAVLASLTIRLPLGSAGDQVEVGFAHPVTVLIVQDVSGLPVVGAPTNAYGPGAALQFQYIGGVWIYWK
jgi:hypothetical protein